MCTLGADYFNIDFNSYVFSNVEYFKWKVRDTSFSVTNNNEIQTHSTDEIQVGWNRSFRIHC